MSSYLNVLLSSGHYSHQVMDTFIKLILIICFKLHAGMVAVLQMLKGLQSLNSDTTYNSTWSQLDTNYFWNHYIDTIYAYRMCFDCQWYI